MTRRHTDHPDSDASIVRRESSERDALTRRTVLAGGAAAAGAATLGALGGLGTAAAAAATTELEWQPRLLSQEQALLLSRLCDLILPRTAIPGALDARVPQWIDLDLSLADAADGLAMIGGLTWVGERAATLHDSNFSELSETQQVDLLREISDEHEDHSDDLRAGAAFFADLKRRTLFAYFTSRTGQVEALGRPAEVERTVFEGCAHDDGDHSA